jgi:hypothetical protein
MVIFLLAFLALAAMFTSIANAAAATTTFSSKDIFAIPECNSQIRFAAGGSYSRANLKGNTWVFDDLNFSGANVWSFSIIATDCNVTITGVSGINMPDQIGWVTYDVTGVGSQTIDLSSLDGNAYGFVSEYVVFIDGANKTKGDGWTFTPFTITGATTNVSIGYTGIYNPVTLEPPSASQPPSPTPTASSTPSAEDQPQGQAIYTVTLIGVVLAIVVIAFAVKSQLRPRIKR